MSRHRSALLLSFFLVACGGGSAEGTWEGRCDYDPDNGVDLLIEITDGGNEARGTAVGAFDTFGYLDIQDGTVAGTVKGSTFEINIEFDNDVELDIIAEIDGDVIEGDCSDSFGNEGDLELESEE